MGDAMEDNEKTREQLVNELTKSRSQSTTLKKSMADIISYELAADESRRYAESIVETVRESLLVLDADLKIISVNRNFFRTFKVTPGETIGSFIYDLGNRQWDIPKLRELLEKALPEKEAFDDFEVDHNFQDIGHKIMLLNARQIYRKDIGAKMILLAIEDITERKEIENGLEKTRKELETAKISGDEAREYAESIINTVREPLIALDHDLRVITASHSFYVAFRVKPEETVGQPIYDLGNKQWDIPKLRELLETILPEKTTFDNYEVEHDFATIGRRIMLLNARQIKRVFGKERIILLAIEDITERKRLEDLLTESEERFRRLFETANDGIVLLEKGEGKITHANPATEKMLGYTKKDSIGNKLQDIGVLLDMGDFQTTMQNLNKIGIINYDDVPVETKSGQHIDTEIYLVDRATLVQCNIRDITERKRAEEALRESEELFRSYLEYAPDGVYMSDLEGNFLYGNRKCEEIIGHRREELIGKNFLELNILPEKSLNKAAQLLQANIEGKSTGPDEIDLISKEGHIIPVEISTSVVQRMGQRIVLAFVRDITERKRAVEALRESEEKYRWVLNNMADVITVMDMNLHFTYISPSIIRMRGYTAEETVAQTLEQVMTPESLQISAKVFEEEMKLEASGTADLDRIRIVEAEQYRKDGSIVLIESHLSFMRDEAKKPVGIISVSHDITDRKLAEDALKQSEERYRGIFENAQEGIFRSTPEGKIIMSNQAMANMFGYESTEERKMMTSITDMVRQLYVNKEDLRIFEETIKEQGFIRGYEAQNYRKDGSIIWISLTMHAVRDETGQIMHYDGIILDITNRKQAVERIKKALGATVQAIAVTVETRDPYTAGHQRRVADLACTIAMEMNLPIDQIDGIRMAAAIHDLGKISVPAEILSKPTKLTNIEFSLIQTHPQSGYDILKDIEFPWPVARMVLEHHERMNGSGYPNGLTGDNILMESRILSVADVVESMASHRPYRPSLGIDAALNEIEKNSGICYDNAVADACLRLFREKGFILEGA